MITIQEELNQFVNVIERKARRVKELNDNVQLCYSSVYKDCEINKVIVYFLINNDYSPLGTVSISEQNLDDVQKEINTIYNEIDEIIEELVL